MRRRACVLSAAALVGTVLGAAAPVAAGEPTAEVSPHTVAPGGTITVTVTCAPTGGTQPDSIDARSQAFAQGSVALKLVSGGEDGGEDGGDDGGEGTGTGRDHGASEPGTGSDPAWGNDPATGGDASTGNDPASGNDPATGGDPAGGYGPEAGSTPQAPPGAAPDAAPDAGRGLDPVAPDPGTVQPSQVIPAPSADPGSAAVPAPPAFQGERAASEAAVLTAGFRAAPVGGTVGVLTGATAVRVPGAAPRTAPAPATEPDTSSGLVYRGTARIAPAEKPGDRPDAAGGPSGASESSGASEWSVDGTCPAAPGGQGKRWSATFTVERGGEPQGKDAHDDRSRAPSPAPDGMRHGVEAGEGGAFTDSVPALVAGCLLIAGALVAAVQRVLVHRGLTKHR